MGWCSGKAVGCWDCQQAGNGEEAAAADRACDADKAAAAGHRRFAGAGPAPGLALPLMMCSRRSRSDAWTWMDAPEAAKMMPNKQACIRIRVRRGRSSGFFQGKRIITTRIKTMDVVVAAT